MDFKDLQKRYEESLMEEKNIELDKNSDLIKNFISHCKSIGINIEKSNIDYIQTIGIVAEYANIVSLLNSKLIPDKEGLLNTKTLEEELTKKNFEGYYYAHNYMVMASNYYRRGYSKFANFAPRFIEKFWKYNQSDNDLFLSIEEDRVRINVDNRMYMEFDTWFGASFKRDIENIPDGTVKMHSPLTLSDFELDFFFGGNYSLDIYWYTKIEGNKKIKVFQSEEFKTADKKITLNSIVYYPVRYVHAEYDIEKKCFRHFDGAIHFYLESEYYQRRDSDFNFNQKSDFKLKTLSKKLFKINGNISVEDWIELSSQFMTKNPLVFEYFEGHYPENIQDMLEKLHKI